MKKIVLGMLCAFALTTSAYADDAAAPAGDAPKAEKKMGKKAKKPAADAPADAPKGDAPAKAEAPAKGDAPAKADKAAKK